MRVIRQRKHISVFFTAIFSVIFLFSLTPVWADDEPAVGDGGSGPDEPAEISGNAGPESNYFTPDYFTGAATYRISIKTPPGRAGIEPNIYLDYDSHRKNYGSPVGYGWEIGLTYIQRSLNKGIPSYDNSDEFILHSNGSNTQLVKLNRFQMIEGYDVACQEFRLKVDTTRTRYFKCNQGWVAFNKDGTRYRYGSGSASTIASSLDPDDEDLKEFRWYLDEVRDTNDNFMSLAYNPLLSVRSIRYTRHGTETGPIEIEFQYSCADPDFYHDDYTPGFAAPFNNTCRLDSIDIKIGGVVKKQYEFDYTEGSNANILVLSSVRLVGIVDGDEAAAIPHTTFVYNSGPIGDAWDPSPIWNDPAGDEFPVSDANNFFDMNGDGLVDRVVGRPGENRFDVYTGTVTGFSAVPDNWGDIFTGNPGALGGNITGTLGNARTYIYDMNGDGLPDRVFGGSINITGEAAVHTGFFVRINNGEGWNWGGRWNDPLCDGGDMTKCGQINNRYGLVDMNGDGLPDRVEGRINSEGGDFKIYFNTGSGFRTTPVIWDDPVTVPAKRGYLTIQEGNKETVFSRDMDGDGRLDRVQTTVEAGEERGYFNVFINTGTGWVQSSFWGLNPTSCSHIDETHDIFDMDGDGLPDCVVGDSVPGTISVYYNLRRNFSADPAFVANDPIRGTTQGIINFYSGDGKKFRGFMDISGDGFPDRIVPGIGATFMTAFMQSGTGPLMVPNVLRRIDNGIGAVTELGYSIASRMEKPQRFLPFSIHCLTTVTTTVGGEVRPKQIEYAGGDFYTRYYNPFAKTFNGFQLVRITDHLGRVQKLWYHQGRGSINKPSLTMSDDSPNFDVRVIADDETVYPEPLRDVSLSGRVFKKAMFGFVNDSGEKRLISKEINAWGTDPLERDEEHSTYLVYFPHLDRQIKLFYGGAAAPKITAKEWEYNSETTNLTDEYDYGEVTWNGTILVTPVDREHSRHIHWEYADPTGMGDQFITGKPRRITVTSVSGEVRKNETTHEYGADGRGNLLSEMSWNTGLDGARLLETTYADYDEYGNPHTITDPAGNVTSLTYDLTFPQYVNTRTVHVTRAPGGIPKSVDIVTTTEFDPLTGKRTLLVEPFGRRETRTYDPLGRLDEVHINGRLRENYSYFYDITSIPWTFEFHGVRRETHLQGGISTTIIYRDGKGRVVQESVSAERGGFRTVRTEHLETTIFWKIRRSEPVFRGSDGPADADLSYYETELDSLGRKISVTPPTGDAFSPTGPATFEYLTDGDPWLHTITDPEGKVKREHYDGFGRMTSLEEYVGGSPQRTNFEYDFWGNIERVLYPRSGGTRSSMTAVYNNRGLKERLTDPNMGTWNYRYDDVGNMTSQTDARGVTAVINYDEFNRVYEKVSSGGGVTESRVDYYYDENIDGDAGSYDVGPGQLYKVMSASGSTRFGYDENGYVEKTGGEIFRPELQSFETTMENNFDGTVASMTFPKGRLKLAYEYDRAGHLIKVCEGDACGTGSNIYYEINPSNGFNAKGQLLAEQFGNGVTTRFNYYRNSFRLEEIINSNLEDEEIRHLTYTYDRVANVRSIEDGLRSDASSAGLTSIRYDDLHRLIDVQYTGADDTAAQYGYTYDALGNFITNNESFGPEVYRYGAGPHAVTQIGSGPLYGYDRNGNMTSGGGRTLIYDAENHLVGVTMENGHRVEFFYDYAGNRIAKKDGDNISYYVGDYFEIENRKYIHHVYAGGKRIATIGRGGLDDEADPLLPDPMFHFRDDVDDDWPPPDSTDFFYYIHTDHLGSSNLVTEGAERATHNNLRYTKGMVVQRTEYTPFGKERYTLNPTLDIDPRYTDQTYDVETGLYYYGARFYDPRLGRFAQADNLVSMPFSSQGYNRYAYVLNNPLKYIDPTGNSIYICVGQCEGEGSDLGLIGEGDIVDQALLGDDGTAEDSESAPFKDSPQIVEIDRTGTMSPDETTGEIEKLEQRAYATREYLYQEINLEEEKIEAIDKAREGTKYFDIVAGLLIRIAARNIGKDPVVPSGAAASLHSDWREEVYSRLETEAGREIQSLEHEVKRNEYLLRMIDNYKREVARQRNKELIGAD